MYALMKWAGQFPNLLWVENVRCGIDKECLPLEGWGRIRVGIKISTYI
jgi:hypothetical protein